MLHFYVSANKIQGRNYEEINHVVPVCGQGCYMKWIKVKCFIICLIFTSCADIIYSVRRLDKSQMVWFVPQRCFSFSINAHV